MPFVLIFLFFEMENILRHIFLNMAFIFAFFGNPGYLNLGLGAEISFFHPNRHKDILKMIGITYTKCTLH